MKPNYVTVSMSVTIHEDKQNISEKNSIFANHAFTMPIAAAGSTNLNMVANALHQLALQDGIDRGLIVLPVPDGEGKAPKE